MTLIINLEPEKEARLRERAARRGRDADDYALDLLNDVLSEPDAEPLMETGTGNLIEEPTLAELFAGRTGLVDSKGKYNYSSHTGKAYTESILKQREQAAKTKEG